MFLADIILNGQYKQYQIYSHIMDKTRALIIQQIFWFTKSEYKNTNSPFIFFILKRNKMTCM